MKIEQVNEMTKDIRKKTLRAILGIFVLCSIGTFYMVWVILLGYNHYPEEGSSLTTWFGYAGWNGLFFWIFIGQVQVIGEIIHGLIGKIDGMNAHMHVMIKRWYRGIPQKEAADVAYKRFMSNHNA